MKARTNNLGNGQLPVKQQPDGCTSVGNTLASHSHSANTFIFYQLSSVAAGHRAAVLQRPPIIAGLPSAVAWSHPTVEGVSSITKERQSVIGWVHSMIHQLPSIAARCRSFIARLLGNASKTPLLEEYTAAQARQMITYWLRWVRGRGDKGPLVGPKYGAGSWSELVSATIPE